MNIDDATQSLDAAMIDTLGTISAVVNWEKSEEDARFSALEHNENNLNEHEFEHAGITMDEIKQVPEVNQLSTFESVELNQLSTFESIQTLQPSELQFFETIQSSTFKADELLQASPPPFKNHQIYHKVLLDLISAFNHQVAIQSPPSRGLGTEEEESEYVNSEVSLDQLTAKKEQSSLMDETELIFCELDRMETCNATASDCIAQLSMVQSEVEEIAPEKV